MYARPISSTSRMSTAISKDPFEGGDTLLRRPSADEVKAQRVERMALGAAGAHLASDRDRLLADAM